MAAAVAAMLVAVAAVQRFEAAMLGAYTRDDDVPRGVRWLDDGHSDARCSFAFSRYFRCFRDELTAVVLTNEPAFADGYGANMLHLFSFDDILTDLINATAPVVLHFEIAQIPLSGQFPPTLLARFSKLTTLRITRTNLHGTLDLRNITATLTNVTITHNLFSSVVLNTAHALTSLDLHGNLIEGQLGDLLLGGSEGGNSVLLRTVEWLDVSENLLSGHIDQRFVDSIESRAARNLECRIQLSLRVPALNSNRFCGIDDSSGNGSVGGGSSSGSNLYTTTLFNNTNCAVMLHKHCVHVDVVPSCRIGAVLDGISCSQQQQSDESKLRLKWPSPFVDAFDTRALMALARHVAYGTRRSLSLLTHWLSATDIDGVSELCGERLASTTWQLTCTNKTFDTLPLLVVVV
eukprot:CAMPEP_0198369174 /NCGR_PEP_ID=MMETSP1450-20131203/156076_1 /TAXON_ID=753684 ORGANISM="Madagascaria erythrocladiodes, Strain CCMP3234" /NCGR_SAMPLE_ID=MMETSP1450 /ASSEMBLY_ACC=CAM_ASM_001115 /LENGTH=404 /DNA_ID=CAMNT_0044076693 /DNA_START=60 /DNA_END=1271 /DNA_ORIENTATION=-